MKVYVIVDKDKNIQTVTSDCDEAINFVNNDSGFRAIPYEVKEPETKMKSIIEFGERDYSPLHYNSTINFGKHRGKTVGDLLMETPDYLQWAVDNINLKLDEECSELLLDAMDNFNKGAKR